MDTEHFQKAMDKALGDTGVDNLETQVRAAFLEVLDKAKQIFTQGYQAGFEAGTNPEKPIVIFTP